MLTGIPKFVLVAGYKEGIFFNEFVKIDSISGISIRTPSKLSIFNKILDFIKNIAVNNIFYPLIYSVGTRIITLFFLDFFFFSAFRSVC